MDATTAPARHAPLTHGERRRIVFGVLLPLFLGSLDQTSLATALPIIGAELGHVTSLPWLITIYLLASTAITPLYGKISDIHGREFTLRVALMVYVAGSLVCALAPNFYVLLAGRALHGLGGGGLTSLAMVVLGDVASPRDRGRYYAYFSAVFTTSGACGPVFGGFLAQHVHWTAIFWINVPAGIAALVLMNVLLRRLPRHERPHRLDVLGAVFIVVASVAFMLMLNVGGKAYPWLSAPVAGLAVAAAVGGLCFVARLRRAPEPLIPITILADPVVRCAMGVNVFGWGAIIALNIFLPIFLQSVMRLSASGAGLSLIVLMATVNVSAGASGQMLGRVTHYKRLPIFGLALSVAGVAALAWRAGDVTVVELQLILALIGIGFGPVAPLSTVSLQNAVQTHQFGTTLGAMSFLRSLYATMLIAAAGAVVLGGAISPDALVAGAAQPTPAQLSESFRWVFAGTAASMAVGLLCLIALEERPLDTDEARGHV
ncbi:MAG: MFS transporter [Rhizobiales bacterium]|nr:MFS transporter [Hyphomicrobiales bacterium]